MITTVHADMAEVLSFGCSDHRTFDLVCQENVWRAMGCARRMARLRRVERPRPEAAQRPARGDMTPWGILYAGWYKPPAHRLSPI